MALLQNVGALLMLISYAIQAVNAGPAAARGDNNFGAMALAPRSLLALQSRTINPDLCLSYAYTWPWTQCQQFLVDYNITAAEFADMNPSVAVDCYGWVGGSKYCISMREFTNLLFLSSMCTTSS